VAYRSKYIEEQFNLSYHFDSLCGLMLPQMGYPNEALSHLRKRGIDPKRGFIRGTQMHKVPVDF
jgi:hypothetical protein